jgi:hypothetical protein
MRKYPCMHKLENITVIEERRGDNSLLVSFDDGTYRLKRPKARENNALRHLAGRIVETMAGKGLLMSEFARSSGGSRVFIAPRAVLFTESHKGPHDVELKVGTKGTNTPLRLRMPSDSASSLIEAVNATGARLNKLEFRDPANGHNKMLIFDRNTLLFAEKEGNNLAWTFSGPRPLRWSFPVRQEEAERLRHGLSKLANEQNMAEMTPGGNRLYASREHIKAQQWGDDGLQLGLTFQRSKAGVPVLEDAEVSRSVNFLTLGSAKRAVEALAGKNPDARAMLAARLDSILNGR